MLEVAVPASHPTDGSPKSGVGIHAQSAASSRHPVRGHGRHDLEGLESLGPHLPVRLADPERGREHHPPVEPVEGLGREAVEIGVGGVGHEFGDPWGAEAVRVGPRAAWLQDDAVRRSWRAEAGHRPFTRTDTRDATAPKAPTTSVCTRLEAAEAEIVRDADGTAGLLVKRFDRVPKAEGGTAMRAQERLSG